MGSDEVIRALNYSAHAIEDLRALGRTWSGWGWNTSASHLDRVVALLASSVKFILPNRCALIAAEDLREAHADLARLPFPCTAFEVPWSSEDFAEHNLGGVPQAEATRRIALCWELGTVPEVVPGLDRLFDRFPGGGVCILSIYWGPTTNGWSIGTGGLFCPYEDRLMDSAGENGLAPLSIAAREATVEAGFASATSKMLRAEPFRLFPEYFEASVGMIHGSEDAAFTSIVTDTQDESSVQLQVCAMLACSNVTTDELEPSEKLNKKRQSKGNQPFFSYKVLTLFADRETRGAGATESGTHAAPRMHLRRGHLRRLSGERLVWVRPAIVNAASPRGVLDKDYRVVSGEPNVDS